MLLLLLSHFSRVRLCVTPETAAHQAPSSLGFSSKNTGVGCHFLLQCMKVKSEKSRSVLSDSSGPHRLQPTRLLCLWDFPGKSTGVGGHYLLCIRVVSSAYLRLLIFLLAILIPACASSSPAFLISTLHIS